MLISVCFINICIPHHPIIIYTHSGEALLMPSSLLSKSESATMGLTFAACLGGFVSTYNLVCLTQMAPLLKLKRNLSQDELVWQLTIATSIFNIGGIFGNPSINLRAYHLY